MKRGMITVMPENEKSGHVAYTCECGKKWSISKADMNRDIKFACKCGRNIVILRGAVFSTPKK